MSLSESKTLSESLYPYPSWGNELLICIDNAIKQAWCNVLTKHSKNISTYIEEKITDALECEIQKIMDKKNKLGFDRSKFQSIVRGAKFDNFNSEHIEKAPDLLIRQIGLTPGIFDSRQDSFFIECKVINGSNQSPRHYIKDGIRRFVDGEYAWCMKNAMMIAYVRDGKKFPNDISVTFKRNIKNACIVRCVPIDNIYSKWGSSSDPQTYKTTHSRIWAHLKYGVPGNIEISHVWLDCP